MNVPKIPENSLKQKIKKIINECERLEEDFGESAFKFNEPATASEIELWEKENKITIPTSYKEWLYFSNGSIIRGKVAHFYSLEEFIVNNEEKSYDVPDDCIAIGELGGLGESLCFSIQNGTLMSFDEGEQETYTDFNEILQDRVIEILAGD